MSVQRVVIAAIVLITVVRCQDAHLEIYPNSKVITKEVGGSLALTCKPVASNTKLISQLEWLDPKNRRIESTNRASSVYVQKLPDEDGSVLIFPKLSQVAEGVYTCAANYVNTESLRVNVTVNTFVEITFVDAPENQYPIIGKDYKIKCKVEGNPSPYIDWNKNERGIESNDRYVIDNDGLTIKNVQESDDGVYKCTAVVPSTGQIKAKDIKVEVQIPPTMQKIDDQSVIEGESATIRCNAKGKPPPEYSWIKKSGGQNLSKTDRFSVKKNSGDLYISRVESNDESLYTCIAENPAGRNETFVKINVLIKPNIFELVNVTSSVAKETKMVCKARGRPPPNISFQKLSSKVPLTFGQQKMDRRITVEQQTFNDRDETIGTMIISDLNRTDDGLYDCIAENSAAKAYKRGHITVEFPPTFERTKDFPPAWSWANNPGNLTCIPEAIPNATIVWKYQGLEVVNDSEHFSILGNSPKSNLIVYPVNDRRYFTHYECLATNKYGHKSIEIELKKAIIPEPVQQVRPQSLTATTIKFSIVPPQQFDGLPLRSISAQYKLERELTWDYPRNHTWSFGAPYILENLSPEMTYHFRFAARNDVGMGPWRNTETISMPRRSQPAEPKIFYPEDSVLGGDSGNRQDLIVQGQYADHYELRWDVPNDNGDPIIRYEIKYCVTEKINGEWRDSVCSDLIQQSVEYLNYELNSLRPDTIYRIELSALNAIGPSTSAQIRMKTAQGMDHVPLNSTAAISSTTIIGIVIGSVLLILLVIDVACFCVNRTGVLAMLCHHAKTKKHDDEDPKLGSYKAAPAHPNSLNLSVPVKLIPSPMEERTPLKQEDQMNRGKQMSVEYDGRKVNSRSGEIIGKNSAV